MKKLLIAFALGAFSFATASAQEEVVIHATKINSTATPHQVVDSVKKKFPDAQAVQYYKVPADGVTNGWEVTKDDNLSSNEAIDKYSVTFKRGTVKYFALYDADGTLLQSRYENSNATLPDPIKASLKSFGAKPEYKGYTIKSKSHYKIVNGKNDKEYYEVVATNGSAKKTVFYAADGTVIKVK